MSETMMQAAMKLSSSEILDMHSAMNLLSEDLRLMKVFSEEKELFLKSLYQSLVAAPLAKSIKDDQIVSDGINQLILSVGGQDDSMEIEINEYSSPKEYGIDIVSPTCRLSVLIEVKTDSKISSESKSVTVNDLYIGNSGIHDEMACCDDAHNYIEQVFVELLKVYKLKPFSNKTESKISPETLGMIMRDLSA